MAVQRCPSLTVQWRIALRVTFSGPLAAVAESGDFTARFEGEARIAANDADHLVVHHLSLDVLPDSGRGIEAMDAVSVLY